MGMTSTHPEDTLCQNRPLGLTLQMQKTVETRLREQAPPSKVWQEIATRVAIHKPVVAEPGSLESYCCAPMRHRQSHPPTHEPLLTHFLRSIVKRMAAIFSSHHKALVQVKKAVLK